MTKFTGLIVICAGCGEPMRDMGEWPVQFPKADVPKNLQQCHRYMCNTCRHPIPNTPYTSVYGIAIVLE